MIPRLIFLFSLMLFSTGYVFPDNSIEDQLHDRKRYSCTMSLIREDTASSISEDFMVFEKSGTHGGPEKSYIKGEDEITVIADGHWLGINWRRENRVIAEAATVVTRVDNSHRVLLLVNPKNYDEQVHLDCHLNDPED